MNMKVILVMVAVEQRHRVAHGLRGKRAAGRLHHFPAPGRLAARPAQFNVDAILLAFPGLAGLVLRRMLHYPVRQLGAGRVGHVETEARSADECRRAVRVGGPLDDLAGFRVAPSPCT